ncbi:MAG: hypothetical protein KJ583_02555 [Nanoarchaeota archaeon]|nr:hypothetical protein [Nanoarchaeota archaeon]MBU1269934.1 hypothetical protein [Nanoarchaeota archaeon]MBU1604175.1 hypothetical protein [Nanoarchaeota archaeon]MBU2443076.1 hypothetical protein [Nanoarchaeota archaeon]
MVKTNKKGLTMDMFGKVVLMVIVVLVGIAIALKIGPTVSKGEETFSCGNTGNMSNGTCVENKAKCQELGGFSRGLDKGCSSSTKTDDPQKPYCCEIPKS